MTSIADEMYADKSISEQIRMFSKRFKLGEAIKRANIYKTKGIASVSLVQYLLNLVFTQRTMHREAMQEGSAIGQSVDAVYRLMRSRTANWARLVIEVGKSVIGWVEPLTSAVRRSAAQCASAGRLGTRAAAQQEDGARVQGVRPY